MSQPVKIFACLLALTLCSCSFSPSPRVKSAQLKLLPPAEGPEDTLLKQKVTMLSQGLNQQFITVLRLQRDRLKLAALLPTGQQLFFLEYDGEELIQKNTSSIDIPGKDVLAIMQFVLWPPNSIQQHYTRDEGWFVDISPEQRSLLTSSGVLLKVSYQTDAVIIVNHIHNYQLMVQPLENKSL
ncbi:MAG: DUF3261 domain-containing protein [Gammaproteobacteria bacterium]